MFLPSMLPVGAEVVRQRQLAPLNMLPVGVEMSGEFLQDTVATLDFPGEVRERLANTYQGLDGVLVNHPLAPKECVEEFREYGLNAVFLNRRLHEHIKLRRQRN